MDTLVGLLFLFQYFKSKKDIFLLETILFTIQSVIHFLFFNRLILINNYYYDELLNIVFLFQNILLWISLYR